MLVDALSVGVMCDALHQDFYLFCIFYLNYFIFILSELIKEWPIDLVLGPVFIRVGSNLAAAENHRVIV